MPDAPRAPCIHPGGCPEYAVRNGRCQAHAARADHDGRKTAARGYDAAWRRFRAMFLGRNPVCADCERRPSKEVHHVKKVREFPHLKLVESNCMGLCHRCHSVRTARGE